MIDVRTILATAGLSVAALTVAGPASAVAWGSAADPVVGYDAGKAFGKVYGNFYNDNSVSAMSTTYQYDSQPTDGNNVRAETDFYFWYNCRTGDDAAEWCLSASKQARETSTASWQKDSRARDLLPYTPKVRGSINICEIQSWSNDPCSPSAIPSFSY